MVYVGGSDVVSWIPRVIPIFKASGIPFQRMDDSNYITNNTSSIVLFVITRDRRNISSMTRAIELMCNDVVAMVLVIEEWEKSGCNDDAAAVVSREIKDIIRSREYLKEAAERHNVAVYDSIEDAINVF